MGREATGLKDIGGALEGEEIVVQDMGDKSRNRSFINFVCLASW